MKGAWLKKILSRDETLLFSTIMGENDTHGEAVALTLSIEPE